MLADVTFRSYTLTHTVESHQLIDQVMDWNNSHLRCNLKLHGDFS
jgi:hypothetical protein